MEKERRKEMEQFLRTRRSPDQEEIKRMLVPLKPAETSWMKDLEHMITGTVRRQGPSDPTSTFPVALS
jgi:hypothetical protein